LNSYELIMIFDTGLGEEKINHLITKVEEKIKILGGEVEKTERWGTRRLASPIKKAKNLTQAYYVLVRFQSAPALPAELQAYLRVNENIVRYIISRAVAPELAAAVEKEISGTPLEAVTMEEIKGEPFGESK